MQLIRRSILSTILDAQASLPHYCKSRGELWFKLRRSATWEISMSPMKKGAAAVQVLSYPENLVSKLKFILSYDSILIH
jgi:hypothetical protein